MRPVLPPVPGVDFRLFSRQPFAEGVRVKEIFSEREFEMETPSGFLGGRGRVISAM